jgi:hypothetical protein
MSRLANETHLEYAQRVGAPRVVPCEVAPSGYGIWVWRCASHNYGFNEAPATFHAVPDRCPMSRLEEWRAKRWAANEA